MSDFTKRLSIQHPRFMDVPGLGEDMSYDEFLSRKSQIGYEFGFDPVWMPDFLYDFQSTLHDNKREWRYCVNPIISIFQSRLMRNSSRDKKEEIEMTEYHAWVKYPCIAIILIFSSVMIGMFLGTIAFLITDLFK